MSRLNRLSQEHQKLSEGFILSGGNLKDLAALMNTSYPTLRKQIDSLMHALTELQKDDEKEIEHILTQVENGEIKAEEGIRLIKEINNEL